ncbi:MAG: hypothetical protein HY744_11415 [Deltaproteobacteria bacterium]|nr:hypothetical protein [Deltaproteobacteria bacterium]
MTIAAADFQVGCGHGCPAIAYSCGGHVFEIELRAAAPPLPDTLVAKIAASSSPTKFEQTYTMDNFGVSGDLGWCFLLRESDAAGDGDLVVCEWGAGSFTEGMTASGTFDAAAPGFRDVHADLRAAAVALDPDDCGELACLGDQWTGVLEPR